MTAKERGNYIKELLSTLTAKEEKILRSYFGIHQLKRYTLEEISKGDQSSREQIKRIKKQWSEKIHEPCDKSKTNCGTGKTRNVFK